MDEIFKLGEQITMYNPEVLRRLDCDVVICIVIADTPACYILDTIYPRHADGETIFISKPSYKP